MTLTDAVIKKTIRSLLKGEDYRSTIVDLIDAAFLDSVIAFFKKLVNAKFAGESITPDWYLDEFLNEKHVSKDFAVHAGLNMKTIRNMHNTGKREVVIDASSKHYAALHESIRMLTELEENLGVTLTLKFNDVSVDLNFNETLIVVNSLAVRRASLRGGSWSTAGKRVEKPLMRVLCGLYGVPKENYKTKLGTAKQKKAKGFAREVDFGLVDGKIIHRCEVKLMGAGNPESADSIFARGTKAFIADKLSENNKAQLDSANVEWVQLREPNGFQRFEKVLSNLGIPHHKLDVAGLDANIEKILEKIFSGKH
ncbi:MAG: CfrBI family restriction endonuclease [Gammaproteobacteria bacterium]